MMRDGTLSGRAIGLFASFATHAAVAAIVLWPGGPVNRFPSTDARAGVVEHAPAARTTPAAMDPSRSALQRVLALQSRTGESSSTREGGKGGRPAEPANHDDSHAWTWIAEHLWQSTVFAIGAGLLTIAFRRNPARVRYALWFAASVKFFVPFALLVTLGSYLPWAPAVQGIVTRSPAAQMIEPLLDVGPASPSIARATAEVSEQNWLSLVILGVWTCGFCAVASIRLRMWRRITAVVRASRPVEIRDAGIPVGVQVRSAPGLLEPGVVGFWRPVLLIPSDIEQHLSRPQLRAVVAHELCHVRRRDNLTAAMHMGVEAIFWFHPLVWWIGARMVEERERACDEDVLRAFEPALYAESILNVGRRYVESPLVCVSGVGGASIRKRIEAIMNHETTDPVGTWKTLALGAAMCAAVAVPVGIGMLSASRLQAQTPAASAVGPAQGPASAARSTTFTVASVTPNPTGGAGPTSTNILPGGRYIATNMPIRLLIGQAYRVSSLRLLGGPGWIESEHFDIDAQADGDLLPKDGTRPLESALRTFLAERFKLAVHTETRQMPIYALVPAHADGRFGPNLSRSSRTDCDALLAAVRGIGGPPPPSPGDPPPCGARTFPGTFAADSQRLSYLAGLISGEVNTTVQDRTGLAGLFNFRLTWTPARLPQRRPGSDDLPPIDPNGPSITTALRDQLGLALVSTTGPVEVLIIDGVERPASQ
jgi:bla regulator protein BlaR1